MGRYTESLPQIVHPGLLQGGWNKTVSALPSTLVYGKDLFLKDRVRGGGRRGRWGSDKLVKTSLMGNARGEEIPQVRSG